jgi:hypothetical protein
MRDGGKGDRKRPLVIDEQQFNANWDAIFNKKEIHDTKMNETLEPNKNKAAKVILEASVQTIASNGSNP